MSDAELKQQRILLNLYKKIKAVTESLDTLEKSCQPFISLGEGLDLNHADTFLELTNSISSELTYIRFLSQAARQNLRQYKKTVERSLEASSISNNPEIKSIQENLVQINCRIEKSLSIPMQKLEARFSLAILKIISLANTESRRLGHNFLGSEQLLLGILEEGTNQAALYLSSVALTPEVLKERIETRIGRGAGAVASEIPLTPNVRRIFALADDYAQNNSTIAPEHLMLGILDLGEGVAVELLRDLAVDTEVFRSHLIEVLSQSNLSNSAESALRDRAYAIESADLFSEAIRVTALSQENGRWACSISGIDSVRPILTYADTKKAAISQSLRQLATKLELELD